MDPVSVFLLVVASIFLIGVLGELAFVRTGVPDVIWLILVGIGLSTSGLVEREHLRVIAPFFGAITLVVVLFHGGSELRLGELGRAAGRGSVLAVASFACSMAAVAGASYVAVRLGWLPESWTLLHCLTLGAILGGSSSVVIMPALAIARLPERMANVINLESAITDVLSVVTTGALVGLAAAGEAQARDAGVIFAKSFGIGILTGTLVGLLAVLTLRSLRKSDYAYPLVLGTLLLLFVVVDALGGSAALAILAAAVMVGNGPRISQLIGLAHPARLAINVTGVHGGITFIVKSFFFTFIGAMIGPPWGMVVLGACLALVLLVARGPSVWLATLGGDFSQPARRLMTVLMPRGMAAGVMAMVPHQAGMPGTEDLPVLVFAAVFGTIVLFALGFPVFKRAIPAEALNVERSEELGSTSTLPEAPEGAAVTVGSAPGESLAPADEHASDETHDDASLPPDASIP